MSRIITVLSLFIFLNFTNSYAQLEKDKVLHFTAGAVAGAGGAFIASELSGHNRFWTFTGSVAASLLVGVAKEAIDQKNYNGWDNADLGATVLGGVTTGVVIDIFTGVSRRKNKQTLNY
ncbi:hypothetical protein [Zeaxanthinibacter enoshimensis]|uniref:Uncharacterized protein n=1 Tax=Zeaxanthinibacter enoshimensis TaxID=392009 RepID=A0A4R6TFU3_9FLAO|nr:hypothetical protein [Zeaxanthinibacter enoshimensis]TDQ29067.1 hypothetical protein CLV82_2516 [Zeaxanthinibacter enoshimensis]